MVKLNFNSMKNQKKYFKSIYFVYQQRLQLVFEDRLESQTQVFLIFKFSIHPFPKFYQLYFKPYPYLTPSILFVTEERSKIFVPDENSPTITVPLTANAEVNLIKSEFVIRFHFQWEKIKINFFHSTDCDTFSCGRTTPRHINFNRTARSNCEEI